MSRRHRHAQMPRQRTIFSAWARSFERRGTRNLKPIGKTMLSPDRSPKVTILFSCVVALYLLNLAAFINLESNRVAPSDQSALLVPRCGNGIVLGSTFTIHKEANRLRRHHRIHAIEAHRHVDKAHQNRRIRIVEGSPIEIEISHLN